MDMKAHKGNFGERQEELEYRSNTEYLRIIDLEELQPFCSLRKESENEAIFFLILEKKRVSEKQTKSETNKNYS